MRVELLAAVQRVESLPAASQRVVLLPVGLLRAELPMPGRPSP